MEFFGILWNEVVTKPMTNSLLVLYVLLASNLGFAIIVFTVVVRGLTFPLVVKQLRSTRRMQQLQPRLKEIQQKYQNNPQLRGQETMKAYKEAGVNPIGCLGPLVVQMPIFIGLFWAINNVLPFTPENLVGLASKLYSWLPFLDTVVPVNRQFLGMDLALETMRAQSVLGYALVGFSGMTMFIQQKMSQMPSMDPSQQSTQRMMLFMFPVMFGMFSLFFPLGLVVYWVVSNVIGIVMQYLVNKRSAPLDGPGRDIKISRLGPSLAGALPNGGSSDDGEQQPRENSKDSGRGDRARDAGTRRRPRRGRSRRR